MYQKVHKALQTTTKEKAFKTNFGEISNLKELRSLLYAKGKKLFNEYVNEEENHFANWVEHVFEDKELSNSLRETKSFHTTLKILDSRIRYLELWLEQNSHKEQLTKFFLKNQKFNIDFEPEFHKFETLSNYDADWINEFFPEKNEEFLSNDDAFEQKLNKEVQMLKDLKEKYQFESKPGLFQRIFKRN